MELDKEKKPIGFKKTLIKHIKRGTNRNKWTCPPKRSPVWIMKLIFPLTYAFAHIFIWVYICVCFMVDGDWRSMDTSSEPKLIVPYSFGRHSAASQVDSPTQRLYHRKVRKQVSKWALDCDYPDKYRRKTFSGVVKSPNERSFLITSFSCPTHKWG